MCFSTINVARLIRGRSTTTVFEVIIVGRGRSLKRFFLNFSSHDLDGLWNFFCASFYTFYNDGVSAVFDDSADFFLVCRSS